MKSIKILVAAAAGWLSLFSASAESSSTQFVGFMTTNQEWLNSSDPTAAYGFYGFDTTGEGGFKAFSPTGPDNNWANCGAAYAGYKFYCYDLYGSWTNYTLTYRVIDATTWNVTDTQSFNFLYSQSSSEESLNARNVPCGLAYDPVDDVIWAVTHAYSNTESVTLCKVDTETGRLIVVAENLPAIRNAACDANGNLYGVGLDCNLYQIGKDGNCTVIGPTGYWPTRDSEIKTGATIDFRSGKMYWSFFGFKSEEDRNWNRNGLTGLLEIDLTTAQTEMLYEYPASQRFSSLSVISAHPSAPDVISDLAYTADEDDYTNGTLSFTVPSMTYGQRPLSGTVGVSIVLDGVSVAEKSAAPGAKFTHRFTALTGGTHNVSVTLSAGGHEGIVASTNFYVGSYVPSQVTDLTLSYDKDSDSAVLNWSTPADAHGGTVNTTNLRYRIERLPGNTVVARSARGNTFSEKVTFPWNSYSYRITPYAGSETGPSSVSNSLTMGTPMELPYDETFDTASSLDVFTLIDANGDGNGSGWDSPEWLYDEQYACAFYYGKRDINADDWLITPSLKFEEGTVYKLTFKYYAYYGYGSKFRVVVGSAPEVDKMDFEILNKETVSSFYDYPGITETVYFAPRGGDSFIGFHHISETMEHLSIDDIHIESYCSAEIPDVVQNLTAIKSADNEVTLTFNLPSSSVGRNPLKGPLTVNIYKDGAKEPSVTITGKNPGEKIVWKDDKAAPSIHVYRIVVSNSVGDGYEAEVSADLRNGTPVAVSEVTATLVNGRQIYLEWPASTESVDESGNPIDTDNIRYLVYKPVPDEDGNVEYRVIARNLSECHYIDNDPRAGLGDGTQYVYYYVAPVNGDDEGYATASNALLLGESATLPFAESWPYQTMENGTWFRGAGYGGTWYVRYKGYDPLTDAFDGSGVASCETNRDVNFGMGTFLSPRFDLTMVQSPELTFYMYQAPEYQEEVQLAIGMDWGDGASHLIPGAVYNARADQAGWRKITVPLDDYTAHQSVSVAFYGYVMPENTIHIDNVSVTGTRNAKELALTGIAVPGEGRTGNQVTVSVDVTNKGTVAAGALSVELSAGSKAIATEKVSALAAGETKTVSFSYTPADSDAGKIVDLAAILTECAASDTNNANNNVTAKLEVKEANSYRVSAIRGSYHDDAVELLWNVPDESEFPEMVLEDVENYRDFAIDNVGAWTMYDGDDSYNYQMSNGSGGTFEWENCREKQAFIVFNTESFRGSLAALPVSGNKYFAAWPAASSANDDWLISPELPGTAQLISFYARTLASECEALEVLVSDSGTDTESFVKLTGAKPVTVSADWNLFHFALPEGTTRFAIRYVGHNGDGVMIDDIVYFGTPICAPEGYNVYRDGVKINSELVNGLTFTDADVVYGRAYRYCIAPVYNGVEMEKSDELVIEASSIASVGADDAVRIRPVAGGVEVTGADGLNVSAYSVDGICHASVTAASVSQFMPLAPGVYVISVGSVKIKVAVR